MPFAQPIVAADSARRGHHFSKTPLLSIRLLAGLGVEGDGHCGAFVKHRSRARYTPRAPNLRQAHLIHEELFAELAAQGFAIAPGDMGENVTTRGIDLLRLSAGTRLRLGDAAVVEITGLRNPCVQMDRFRDGLMQATLEKGADGALVRKAGVMAVVIEGGDVRAGDAIRIIPPAGPHVFLKPV